MLSNSNKNGEAKKFSPLKPESVVITDSTVNEDVVIYDECGDTLWDRVLSQEGKIGSPKISNSNKAE